MISVNIPHETAEPMICVVNGAVPSSGIAVISQLGISN